MKNRISIFLIIALFVTSCSSDELGQAPIPEDYQEQIAEWKQDRIESISEPTGWLRLAGMFWLEEGENSFGSSSEVDIQFPEGTINDRAGTFVFENGIVTMIVEEGVEITHDGEPVTEFTLYDGSDEKRVEHGNLEWFVIVRDDITAIRLFNKENEKADAFTGFPTYPVDPKWARTARYIPNPEGTTIPIVNVLGQQIDAESPGVLEFTLDGERYTLDGIINSTQLFIILSDETNKDETYQAGRYLYVDYPEEGSEYTVVDFNKVYNPPCAYNVFTTCQLPPQQNRLDIAIPAGEKRPVDWEGL
tara:strand:- start:61241 stop:62152 length:912 start_codon:yes stop_codon:yes gene_type:complete